MRLMNTNEHFFSLCIILLGYFPVCSPLLEEKIVIENDNISQIAQQKQEVGERESHPCYRLCIKLVTRTHGNS